MKSINLDHQKLAKRALECKEYSFHDLPHYDCWSQQYVDDEVVDMCTPIMDLEASTLWLHPEEVDKTVEELFQLYDDILIDYMAESGGYDHNQVSRLLAEVRGRHSNGAGMEEAKGNSRSERQSPWWKFWSRG